MPGSTSGKDLQINDAILSEAETNTPKSGYETQQFYTLAVDPSNGRPLLTTVDDMLIDASQETSNSPDAGSIHKRPQRAGYTGYLVEDGIPDNGYALFGHGIAFPLDAKEGDYFLRTDFLAGWNSAFDTLEESSLFPVSLPLLFEEDS
jgi:hypothetical protein